MSTIMIAFKVQLARRDREPVFHRFSGSYTFSELSTVISHLWGERPKHLVLDYTDDEGDQVRFTSESEWEECVRIHQSSGAAVLRLTGKRAKDTKDSKRNRKDQGRVEANAGDSEDGVYRQNLSECAPGRRISSAPVTRTSVPVLPDIFQELQQPLNLDPLSSGAAEVLQTALFGSQSTSQPASVNFRARSVSASPQKDRFIPQCSVVGDTQPTSSTRSGKTSASSSTKSRGVTSIVECDANSAAVDLMSMMYKCDAGVELFKGATEQFGSVVKRLVNPFDPTEVHLDIDRNKLYRDVVTKGNALIDAGAGSLGEAEALLRNALVVFNDSVILEYNLACVLSLQNRVEESLQLLFAAKAHGYDDVHQLQTDADLANARTHPRFSEVVPEVPVAVVEPEPEAAAVVVDAVPEPTPVSVPTPVVGSPGSSAPTSVVAPVPTAAPATAVDPQVLTFLSVFPELTLEEATNAMNRAQGNLARAVNARLSGE